MTSTKYIGMDVHKESISIAVRNSVGKVVMECVIETKASTILQFIDGLRGDVRITFEEGTWAAWLYDLVKPHVTEGGHLCVYFRCSPMTCSPSHGWLCRSTPCASFPPRMRSQLQGSDFYPGGFTSHWIHQPSPGHTVRLLFPSLLVIDKPKSTRT